MCWPWVTRPALRVATKEDVGDTGLARGRVDSAVIDGTRIGGIIREVNRARPVGGSSRKRRDCNRPLPLPCTRSWCRRPRASAWSARTCRSAAGLSDEPFQPRVQIVGRDSRAVRGRHVIARGPTGGQAVETWPPVEQRQRAAQGGGRHARRCRCSARGGEIRHRGAVGVHALTAAACAVPRLFAPASANRRRLHCRLPG